MPIVDSPDDEGTSFLSNRGMHNIWILGKLKPESAHGKPRQPHTIARGLASQYPQPMMS